MLWRTTLGPLVGGRRGLWSAPSALGLALWPAPGDLGQALSRPRQAIWIWHCGLRGAIGSGAVRSAPGDGGLVLWPA